MFSGYSEKRGLICLLLGDIDIALELISNTKPTVNIKKNNTATANPNVLTLERVTPKGSSKTNSKSKTKNSMATTTKWIWKDSRVCEEKAGIPHSYWLNLDSYEFFGASKIFNPKKIKAKIGTNINKIIKGVFIKN